MLLRDTAGEMGCEGPWDLVEMAVLTFVKGKKAVRYLMHFDT